MARHGCVRLAGWALISVLAAAGLTGCGDDGAKTTTAGSSGTTSTENAAGTSSTTACTFSGATVAASGGGDAPTRLLTDVRVGAHGCYDRVTFELKPQPGESDGPVGWKAAYETGQITEDGSGHPVKMKGAAFLVVTMSATGVDLSQEAAPATYTGPASIESADTTRIQQVRRTGDFEGVITWVLGLDQQRPFHVSTQDGPARVIVDIGD